MKNIYFSIRLLITLSLLAYLFSKINLFQLWDILNKCEPLYIILAILVICVDRLLMALKWNLLLRAKGIILDFASVVKIYLIGSFLGTFLPATVGTDLARLHSLSKYNLSVVDSTPSVIMERILGILTLCFLASASAVISTQILKINIGKVIWFVIILAISIASLLYFSLYTPLLSRTRASAKGRIIIIFNKFYLSFKEYSSCTPTLLKVAGWSIIEHFVSLSVAYIVSLSLNLNIPFVYFLVFIPLSMIITRLPISIDGLGIREGSLIFLFSKVGVAGSSAFMIGMMPYVLNLTVLLLGAYFYIAQKRQGTDNPSMAKMNEQENF